MTALLLLVVTAGEIPPDTLSLIGCSGMVSVPDRPSLPSRKLTADEIAWIMRYALPIGPPPEPQVRAAFGIAIKSSRVKPRQEFVPQSK